MGDEIQGHCFSDTDYSAYYEKLKKETEALKSLFEYQAFSSTKAMCGIEQEAWITNSQNIPIPENQFLLNAIKSNLLSPELAKFNIELNVHPRALHGTGLRQMHQELSALWKECETALLQKKWNLHMIGILPTIQDDMLTVDNMSQMNRYHALNEQVLKQRQGKPLNIDIVGVEHLKSEHRDVMLESAATSFQMHRQIPANNSARYYNAAVIVSAPLLAISANSPFLFGRLLWDETRIPLFEQAVEAGGYGEASHGPIRRVTFGSAYVKTSVFELFQENLSHYPVLLPTLLESDESLPHVRMHNGTIWRWNRPLIGFDDVGEPHLRIEHRGVSAGPTIIDEMANSAFFYGLQEFYANTPDAPELSLSFSEAKGNFYQAAQHGIKAKLQWLNGKKVPVCTLLLDDLLEKSRLGLNRLVVAQSDIHEYLSIIEGRVRKKQTGAEWQKQYAEKCQRDMEQLSNQYWEFQSKGNPVHEWDLS